MKYPTCYLSLSNELIFFFNFYLFLISVVFVTTKNLDLKEYLKWKISSLLLLYVYNFFYETQLLREHYLFLYTMTGNYKRRSFFVFHLTKKFGIFMKYLLFGTSQFSWIFCLIEGNMWELYLIALSQHSGFDW